MKIRKERTNELEYVDYVYNFIFYSIMKSTRYP